MVILELFQKQQDTNQLKKKKNSSPLTKYKNNELLLNIVYQLVEHKDK